MEKRKVITPERLKTYKDQALAAVAARAKNPKAPGVSCVAVTPHDLLDLILMFEETLTAKGEQK
jgi:hypothetical protein